MPGAEFDPDWEGDLEEQTEDIMIEGKPVTLIILNNKAGFQGEKGVRNAVSSLANWDKIPIRVLKIEDLVFDWRFYPRSEVDDKVVKSYAKALQAGSVFPPVKIAVFAGKNIIVDGVHRVESRKLLKIEYADCAVHHFDSEGAMFAEAVKLNSSHGKSFSQAEIRASIRTLKRYNFSVSDIVAFTHVPAAEIQCERTKPVTVVTAPRGRKIDCQKGEVAELLRFKNALVLCCSWAEQHRIPTDNPGLQKLVVRCRLALGKVRFNA